MSRSPQRAVTHARRRFFVPEVVQSSAMDCGPASLACLLAGFGISASYGRLREACQTDVDGTSVGTMEELACALGLDAEQMMIPVDHILVAGANVFPAIIMVRLANGATHFVVAWRRHGGMIQLMDPGVGRRFVAVRRFVEQVHMHRMPVPQAGWRAWAESEEARAGFLGRMRELGLREASARRKLDAALGDPGWERIASLDAAIRMTRAVMDAGGLRPGAEANALLDRVLTRTTGATTNEVEPIPPEFWSVRPGPPDEDGEAQLLLRGAVLVRCLGRKPAPASDASTLPIELASALAEQPTRPGRHLWATILADGMLAPPLVLAGLLLVVVGVLVEAVLLRSLLDLLGGLGTREQRLWAALSLVGFTAALSVLDLALVSALLRMGRRLETRLRAAFMAKLPRLSDRYLESRLKSDMAERAHAVVMLRGLPGLAGEALEALFGLVLTVAGIVWLDPRSFVLAVVAAAVSVAIPSLAQRTLSERDMRVRAHVGALTRFYLDALLGLAPLRTHGAERSMRRQHDGLLVDWARARWGLQRVDIAVESLAALAGFSLAIWMLVRLDDRDTGPGTSLLLVYWSLSLPMLGQRLDEALRQYPLFRNVALRLLDPLTAAEEEQTDQVASPSPPVPTKGARLELDGVTVRVAGHTILDGIDLEIAAGEHVAVVGPSGAGKSTLVGLFLGWHRPARGELRIDGGLRSVERLAALRRQTAWVDPAVTLWNRTLLSNLRYGAPDQRAAQVGRVIDTAELHDLLERLPQGLATPLGAGGGLVSGGEGQRVRLGRALLRPDTRLAVLDEPFRGLGRDRREVLMDRARAHWSNATLICITHDVAATRHFPRVIVVEDGRIAEDGAPAELLADPSSRYAELLAAEEEVRTGMWRNAGWRHTTLDAGLLLEEEPSP